LEIKGIQLDITGFDKAEYKDRKMLGKLICKEILKRMEDYDSINKLAESQKQDDLCDCFVQGVEYLQTAGQFSLV